MSLPNIETEGETDDAVEHEGTEVLAEDGLTEQGLADLRGEDEHGLEQQAAGERLGDR